MSLSPKDYCEMHSMPRSLLISLQASVYKFTLQKIVAERELLMSLLNGPPQSFLSLALNVRLLNPLMFLGWKPKALAIILII